MRHLLILLFTLINVMLLAQATTFNKRMDFGQYAVVLSAIETTDSCYYATGVVAHTPSADIAPIFIKYDTLGNTLFYKIFYDSIGSYQTWQPTLCSYIDGNLVVSTYYTDSTFKLLGGVLKYNTSGDVIWQSLHDSPYYPAEDFMRPDDMRITADSGYILVTTVNNPIEAADISILKLDKDGNEEWHIIRGVTNYVEHSPCVYTETDGSYVIGYMQDDLTGVQMNYTIRSKLEKLDSAGNSIWTYQSPVNEQIHGVNDLIKSKDGGWVVASAWGYEYPINANSNMFLNEAYVYKLDSNRNFLWGRKFSSDSYLPREQFNKIVELEDSSLVAFGIVERQYPQPNPTYNIIHGRIVKLSPQGDSLWNREYEYLTSGNGLEQSIYDAERTYDGGFLVCGEANGITTSGGPYQQGWLLKLDEHGCLVPGCHLGLGILPVGAVEQIDLSLYPNPTSDYLNVHYRAFKVGEELTFSVIDMQGRVLQTYHTADVSDKTYIVPVYDLVGGVYVLELQRDGVVLGSEMFVRR